MKTKISLIVLLLIAAAGRLHAQVDPHFSQYYAYPMWLNPALTGVFNGDTRVSANYKNQWANVNRAYQTTAVSADIKPTDKLSVGLTVLNQSSGGSSFNYFSGYGSVAYSITVSGDENQRVNFGLQAGLINRSFDMGKLQFGNQFNPGMGYDPSLPSYENFSTTNTTVFDAGAGIFYYNGDPDGKANLFGGVSVAHLSRPKDGFAANTGNGPQRIPMRYMAQAGVRIKALDGVDITPNALFIQQQKTSIKALGVYSEFRFQNDNGLIMGGMYRLGDAAVASLGYHVNSLIVGASYDFNTSQLTRATNGNGGIELSISYVFRKRVQQPEPICPRL